MDSGRSVPRAQGVGVFVSASLPPPGIVLDPVFTQIAINDFAGEVEFFKTLPSIDNPLELRNPEFQITTTVTADTWLSSVKGQVFNQWFKGCL